MSNTSFGLYEVQTEQTKTEFVRPAKLNVLIADVSGSMGWAINKLAQDTVDRCKRLPQGDAVLVGVFSSQGWFRWIAARELSTNKDYDVVTSSIKDNFRVVGATCFSEILADTPQAIRPFLSKFNVVSLVFMSDGHPVVSNRELEEKAIFEAAKAVRDFIVTGAVVAYGDYANRSLLSAMAQTLGVELVTTDDVAEVGNTFERLAKAKGAKAKRVKVPRTAKQVFAVEDQSVKPLTIEQDSVLAPETARVFFFDEKTNAATDDPVASYAAALFHLSQDNFDRAVDVLSDLGDVHIVNMLDSAISNSEIARAEAQIREALTNPRQRFLAGRVPGCRAPIDMPDVIGILELFHNTDASLDLTSPDFKYKRIGPRTTVRPGYPEFQKDQNFLTPFSRLTWHSSELNLSVGVTIPGQIELPDEVTVGNLPISRETLGLPKQFRTFQHRNYSIVSNGYLMTNPLPVNLGKSAAEALAKLLNKPVRMGYQVFDFSLYPLCNKLRGKVSTNWDQMAENAIKSVELGAQIKVFKDKRNTLDPERAAERSADYTNDQWVFLEACGITRDGSYSPPSDVQPYIDTLNIREFEVKVAKSSSVSMKDFKEMLDKKKKINWMGSLMAKAHDQIEAKMPPKQGEAVLWLNKTLEDLQAQKRKLDFEVNAQRYAAVMSGAWAREKTDAKTIDLPSGTATLVFRTTTKNI